MSGSYTLERALGSGAEGLGRKRLAPVAIDRTILSNRAGKLVPKRLAQILASIDLALGR